MRGAEAEEDWKRLCAEYKRKYPKEGAEFEMILSKELPEGWEKALPVKFLILWLLRLSCTEMCDVENESRKKKSVWQQWSTTGTRTLQQKTFNCKKTIKKMLFFTHKNEELSIPMQVWKPDDEPDATRGYSEVVLNALAKVVPGMLGGSADLATSNKVYLGFSDDFERGTPAGRNIRYGIREHGMASIRCEHHQLASIARTHTPTECQLSSLDTATGSPATTAASSHSPPLS